MTFSADCVYLPDVNVWIAAVSDRHEHHAVARQWFDSNSTRVCFCRVTQMAFIRLLTNPKVMGDDVLVPAEAIAVYCQLLADERVCFDGASEPRKRVDFLDGYANGQRQRVDRRIPGSIRHRGRPSYDHLRPRYAQVAGASVGIVKPNLEGPIGYGHGTTSDPPSGRLHRWSGS